MEKNNANPKRTISPPHSSSGLSKSDKVKRMSSGIELPKKDFCDSIPRKLRSAISKRSYKSVSKHSIHGVGSLRKNGCSTPITKEEKEVAETLFALAGMIPLNTESSEAKTKDNDPMSSSEDPGKQIDKSGTACNGATPSIETSPLSFPKLSERRQLNQDLKASGPQINLQDIPSFLRTCNRKQLPVSATNSQISTAAIWPRGVNDEKQENVSFPLSQSQHFVDPLPIDTITNQERDALCEIGPNGLHIKSSASVFPSRATASSSNVLVDKASSSVHGTVKPRKRCITHVYISHMIQENKRPKRKEDGPLDSTCQMLPPHSSSIAPDMNGLNGAFTSHMFGSTTYNRLPMNLKHREDKDDGSKKQGFEFLSLSNGVGANRLHSVTQASSSVPQNNFSSKVYRDQVAVASMAMLPGPSQVQLQLPQYFANAFNPAIMSSTATAKATQFTQPKSQQQQHQMWTSQLAAQFRTGPLLPSHIANWQNLRQDPRISSQHKQPSLESIGIWTRSAVSGQDPRISSHHIQPHTGQFLCNERL